MRKLLPILLSLLIAGSALGQAKSTGEAKAQPQDFYAKVKATIEGYLGRPYVWGSSGLKSFDCSGFIWRVMVDNGILLKRTTARKFYMTLPKVDENQKWQFGTLVFFDDLKHVGIVDSPRTFYHSQVSKGTNLSEFNSFWRPKIYGFRVIPVKEKSDK